MNASTATFEYQHAPDVAVEIVSDEALLWDPHTETLHHLSPTATAIWNVCGTWIAATAVERMLQGKFRESAEIGADVDACLGDLVARSVLSVRDSQFEP